MGGFSQLPMQPNPTQDPDPSTGMAGLRGLMEAFRGGAGKPLARGGALNPYEGEQPLPPEVQSHDAMNLAKEVAAAHAAQASKGDPEKFNVIYQQLLTQYSNQGARVGSYPAEIAAEVLPYVQGARGLYSLGKGAVGLAEKYGPGVIKTLGEVARNNKGELDPEKMAEFVKNLKNVPSDWQKELKKKLAFSLLQGKDPFVGKPVPLGAASGSNAATAAARKDWPALLAKSAGKSTPTVPTTGATTGATAGRKVATEAAGSGAARLREWEKLDSNELKSYLRDRGIVVPRNYSAADTRQLAKDLSGRDPEWVTKIGGVRPAPGSTPPLNPEVTKALSKVGGRQGPAVYFDTGSRLSTKEADVILNGVRKVITEGKIPTEQQARLLSRLENVNKYVQNLGDKATKGNLLQALGRQGMLAEPAREVLAKLGYSGLKDAGKIENLF